MLSGKISKMEQSILDLSNKLDQKNAQAIDKAQADFNKIREDHIILERSTNDKISNTKETLNSLEKETLNKINDLETTVAGIGGNYLTRREYLDDVQRRHKCKES